MGTADGTTRHFDKLILADCTRTVMYEISFGDNVLYLSFTLNLTQIEYTGYFVLYPKVIKGWFVMEFIHFNTLLSTLCIVLLNNFSFVGIYKIYGLK